MYYRQLAYYWFLLALFCTGSICCGQAQLDWLIAQQDLHSTGLLESYQDNNDTKAFVFDQALAIITFTHAEEFNRARDILNVMEFLQNQESDGAWDECYDANDPNLYIDYYKHVTGPVAWMVMAINFYEDKTGDANYAPVARTALEWLGTMQHMIPGEERYGSLGWSDYDQDIISTEHNLDVYSAYYWRGIIDSNDTYLYRAGLISDFLQREMWAPSPESNHWHDVFVFWRGLEISPNFCTDPQSWGVLSLGPIGLAEEPFYKSLCWLLDPIDSTRNLQDYSESITDVDGFRGCTGDAKHIEVDFTEHVAAFYSIGDDLNGDYFHDQMDRIVDANGGLVHSFCDNDPSIGYRYNYVASVAWHYFNEVKLNPFRLQSAENWVRAANIDKKEAIGLGDLQVLGASWLEEGLALPANINGEGRVDFLDYSILARYWMCGCYE